MMAPSWVTAAWIAAAEAAEATSCLNSGIAFVGEIRAFWVVERVARRAVTSRPERGGWGFLLLPLEPYWERRERVLGGTEGHD